MDYTTYIKPELLALIPSLNFLAQIMKPSFKLDPHKIPLVIGIAGVILSSIWVLARNGLGRSARGSWSSRVGGGYFGYGIKLK